MFTQFATKLGAHRFDGPFYLLNMIDVAKLGFKQTPGQIEPMSTPANNTLSQSLAELYGRINYERQVKVPPNGFRLDKMRELLSRLGDPQSTYPAVHVAGTKGKGSVSTMVGSILTTSGFRTGVYTSPHLEKINQRMAIDGAPITDAQLLDVLLKMGPVIEAMDQEAAQTGGNQLTFFEITTSAAMFFFAQQSVDFAVLEVGLGGRLDSTNVCEPAVCVITNISLDHTRQLGNTIGKIAREKAGIIKTSVPVVSGATKPDAMAAISEVAAENSATLYQLGRDFSIESPTEVHDSIPATLDVTGSAGNQIVDVKGIELRLPGAHQRTNAALAVAAVNLLDDPHDRIRPESIRKGLAKATLPGRCEIVSTSPLVILDIAHNPASASALAQTLTTEIKRWRSANRRTIIFATSGDKDAASMLTSLAGCCDRIVLTEYQSNPRGFKLDQLIELARTPQVANSLSNITLASYSTPAAALAAVREDSTSDDAICVTGSAFLVAELRPELRD